MGFKLSNLMPEDLSFVSIFFSETNSDGTFVCGWPSRPLEPITSQYAYDCISEIVKSAAWRAFACPNNVNPY